MDKQNKLASVYQLGVTLRHVSPPVWRRIEVPGDIKLGKLHRILQIAMGWTDSHLHAYRVGGTRYGIPNPDFPDDDTVNERNVRIDSIAANGGKIIYEYDFADGIEARAAGQEGLLAVSATAGSTS